MISKFRPTKIRLAISLALALTLFALIVVGARAAFLTFVTFYKDGSTGGDYLNNPISIAVSPDSKHVYARGSLDDAITAFERDPASGELTVIEAYIDGVGGVDGLNGVFDLAISPDGANLYAVGYSDYSLVVFSRDSATGKLTFVEVFLDTDTGIDGLDFPIAVTLSPDGNYVYVVAQTDASVAVFSRDSGTGALTFVAVYKDFVRLDFASDVAVSPDGKHVYATSFLKYLVVYTRDSSTGELTFVTAYKDGVDGVDGLDNAGAVAISPDGEFVYVAGKSDDAVAIFQRDSGTGELSYIGLVRDGVDGVDKINDPYALAMTSGGEYLFVTSWDDHAVSVFKRDSDSGELSLVEAFVDGVDGVDGLRRAAGLAVSPDDGSLYVAGHIDDAIALFAIPEIVDDDTGDSGTEGESNGTTNPSASKEIDESGTTTLTLGDILVSVPASALAGQTNCRVEIEDTGNSGDYGFKLDDSVWDVNIVCDSGVQHIFFAPITVCIRPDDGVVNDKQVFHRHNDASSFTGLASTYDVPGYVCGQTRVLSLFTLGDFSLPATGFAPGIQSALPPQTESTSYAASGLTLSIPELGLSTEIVGVPQGPNGWDVSWLGDSAGYLVGTAFPTLAGNTVITAHVWGADNQPGPFYELESLGYGDRFTISAWSGKYTYEVRANSLYNPEALGPLGHEDYDWVTLVTCEGFDEATGIYSYRRVVQAVLVSVD